MGARPLAGVHLFDPETGDYNVPYIRRLAAGKELCLVNLTYRMQGWIVPPGNPDGVEGVESLVRQKISFINRQRGAGTRLLLDHLLKEAGLRPPDLYGYEREEHTPERGRRRDRRHRPGRAGHSFCRPGLWPGFCPGGGRALRFIDE